MKLTALLLIVLVVIGGLYFVYTKFRLYLGRFNYHSETIMALKDRVKTLAEKYERRSKMKANAFKDMDLNTREPMWDQAIEYLVSECAMEPTMSTELSQRQIQEIILERSAVNILDLFQDFGRWIGTKSFLYVQQPLASSNGNAFWLLYLMATQYAMEWDGDNWVGIS